MLPRTLEPELMDTAEDASEYDAMDHAAVNELFVNDVFDAVGWVELHETHQNVAAPLVGLAGLEPPCNILDLGAGTAQIPIELARRAATVHITAADAAKSMLEVGRRNVAAAGLATRIELVLADAKHLPFDTGSFSVVISNSIVHHIAEPQQILAEAVRVAAPGGLLFHRDLARPRDEARLQQIVETYAGDATPYQRKLLADSLRAALTVEEMQQLVANLGFTRDSVRMTSDRHWTWIAAKAM